MTTPISSVDGIDLSLIEFWQQPLDARHADFAKLRALGKPQRFNTPESPITVPGDSYYAFVSYADVTEASRQPDLFSSGRGAVSIPDLPPDWNEYFGSILNLDDPRHARIRRIVSRSFTPKMLQKFRDDVQATAASIVDDLLATGPCDFVQNVSAQLPLKIICQMMGIGEEHYDMVLRGTNIILSGGDPEFAIQDIEAGVAQLMGAGQELTDFVIDLAAQRAEHPADDLITALSRANIDGEHLTPAELGAFFILLIVAGNDTTKTAISHALNLLTVHPDQRELLMADLEGRLPDAVEEIVRYVTPVIWMRRSVTRDCTLNGHDYREGDKVVLYYWAANRDESVFADPRRFDITRSPNPHVGFGAAGPHFCLGAHLARREISVMLRELLTRVPRIRAVGEPDRLASNFINGIKHLQCELD